MTVKMCLDLCYMGGVRITRELDYIGDDLEEIGKASDRDQNALLKYMMTGDDEGSAAFCFQGFMFTKKGILAAHLYEPEF